MVKISGGQAYEEMDDLGVPLFVETPMWFKRVFLFQLLFWKCFEMFNVWK